MTIYRMPLSALTLDAVQAEALRSHLKHGDHSVLSPMISAYMKLAALTEEVGEVAHELTYDVAPSKDRLVAELIQVASVALCWVESLEGEPSRVDTLGSDHA